MLFRSELFKNLCIKKEKNIFPILKKILIPLYGKRNIQENKMFLYIKGEDPVLLVSHIDTVFEDGKRLIVHDKEQEIIWSPSGLGADDRAGVAAIISLVSNKNIKPSILFTKGEEIGGYGAQAASKKLKNIKNKFMIELDRRGNNDAVFYDCENNEFKKFIEG